jgi:hypothetical protein
MPSLPPRREEDRARDELRDDEDREDERARLLFDEREELDRAEERLREDPDERAEERLRDDPEDRADDRSREEPEDRAEPLRLRSDERERASLPEDRPDEREDERSRSTVPRLRPDDRERSDDRSRSTVPRLPELRLREGRLARLRVVERVSSPRTAEPRVRLLLRPAAAPLPEDPPERTAPRAR